MNDFESFSDIRHRNKEAVNKRGLLTFVVGMQFGSEAKGSIINHLAPLTSIAVRTGAANAGHTIYHHGEPHVMRQLPAAWTNPYTELVIGPGALISPDVLLGEIERLDAIVPIKNRLRIDQHAHVITEEHIAEEAKGDLGERIGSTSSRGREGIGQAMAEKVLRSAKTLQVKNFAPLSDYAIDTVDYINSELEMGVDVLVEGTQGYGLSIDHGEYPYVTSRNATVSALADSIGVQTNHYRTNVIGVTRSYPIRVAGNSGPFAEGTEELTWDQMKVRLGNPDLPVEQTSVTKLPRRIGTFSDAQYVEACRVNRPDEIALTFADYIDPRMAGRDDIERSKKILGFIHKLESLYEAPVSLVNTGPRTTLDFDWYRRSMLDKVRED